MKRRDLQLTLNEKREIVSKNKDPAIAALQAVLDTYLNLTGPVQDRKDFEDEKIKAFIDSIKNDIITYENLLKKIKRNETLNAVDIAYIGNAFNFCAIRAKRQIEEIEKAHTLCSSISKQLLSEIES